LILGEGGIIGGRGNHWGKNVLKLYFEAINWFLPLFLSRIVGTEHELNFNFIILWLLLPQYQNNNTVYYNEFKNFNYLPIQEKCNKCHRYNKLTHEN
jgi:hypothetical protein